MFPKSNLRIFPQTQPGTPTVTAFVEEAIRLGMDTVGFLSCSFPPFYKPKSVRMLRSEIEDAKQRCAGIIRILYGEEYDRIVPQNSDCDYTVCTVRTLPVGDRILPIEGDSDAVSDAVRRYFNGNGYHLIRAYFESFASAPAGGIVSGFERLALQNRDRRLFDENDPRYLRAMLDALDGLIDKGAVFELNAGTLATHPGLSPVTLRRISERRGRVMLVSEASKPSQLTARYADGVRYLRAAGIGALTVPGETGFDLLPL